MIFYLEFNEKKNLKKLKKKKYYEKNEKKN